MIKIEYTALFLNIFRDVTHKIRPVTSRLLLIISKYKYLLIRTQLSDLPNVNIPLLLYYIICGTNNVCYGNKTFLSI